MNKQEAQLWAADILIEQGYSIIQIGRALEKVDKNEHCLRHYSRNIEMANPGIQELEQCPIDGCLAAVKIGNSVRFGFSVVHPNDRNCMAPKKVTGMVAAAKAYLSPDAAIPLRFAYMFECENEFPHVFIERCAAYFKVRAISANVVQEVRAKIKGTDKTRKIGYNAKKVVMKC